MGHYQFNYNFSDTEGITFRALPRFYYDYDMAIYYGSGLDSNFIDCKCSRWDVSNYSVVIGTWVNKTQAQNLRSNITPSAVGELYKVLGRPTYYDKTWSEANTLRILPTLSSNFMNNSTLKEMRDETLLYVKNYTEHIINENWVEIKIEGYVSGSQSL